MMSRPSSSASLTPLRHGQNDSSQALLSRRGSEFGGSRYIQVDDSGVYMSSLVVTVLVSAIATIGILLFTLVVTLSVMLGSCQGQPIAVSGREMKTLGSCDSFILNAEVNNLQGWTVAKECESTVTSYMTEGQYFVDFGGAVNAAIQYLKTLPIKGDGLDIVVMDIDETALSNIPYYVKHHYGAEKFDESVWDEWVDERNGVTLHATLDLFNHLKAANMGVVFLTGRPESQRNATSENLIAAGYEGWTALALRLPSETGMKAVDYKSQRRLQLEQQGYRIWSSLGDQWSDLAGPAAGSRVFKLPNPMYYIF